MKYKVGDKVRVRTDLVVDDEYGIDWGVMFAEEMDKFRGQVVTIAKVTNEGIYNIKEDDNDWCWTEDMLEPVNDNVNHPSHYTDGKIEVIDFIEDKKLGFHLGNAIKYIARAGKKDKDKVVEDIQKAIWYLNRYLELNDRDCISEVKA